MKYFAGEVLYTRVRVRLVSVGMSSSLQSEHLIIQSSVLANYVSNSSNILLTRVQDVLQCDLFPIR